MNTNTDNTRNTRKQFISKFYPKATEKLKIANGYGTQYYNNFIPRNAIYGRLSQHVYIYVTNFSQFKDLTQNTYEVYLMDIRRSFRFRRKSVKKNSLTFCMILSMVLYNNMYDTKVEYSLNMKQIKYPGLRKPDYDYKQKPTNRVNFGLTTDFDIVPQWRLNAVK